MGSGKTVVTLVAIWDFTFKWQCKGTSMTCTGCTPQPPECRCFAEVNGRWSSGRLRIRAVLSFGCSQETDLLQEAGLGFSSDSVPSPPSPLPLPYASEPLPAHGQWFPLQKSKSEQQPFQNHTRSVKWGPIILTLVSLNGNDTAQHKRHQRRRQSYSSGFWSHLCAEKKQINFTLMLQKPSVHASCRKEPPSRTS